MPKREGVFCGEVFPFKEEQSKRGAGTSGQCAQRQRGKGVYLSEFSLNHLPRHIRGFGDLTQRPTMITLHLVLHSSYYCWSFSANLFFKSYLLSIYKQLSVIDLWSLYLH